MTQKRTLISHFWNEEYLLPWWIKHHREMFEDAILIDWNSTDRSLHEIKKHAPSSWKVVKTKHHLPMNDNECFAAALDEEVMEYERGLAGWRMCLNTTEFLIGDIGSALRDKSDQAQHLIGCIMMYDWKPTGKLDWFKPLWEQVWMGRDCRCSCFMNERSPRSIHNFPVEYALGRHFWISDTSKINPRMAILHYANCISSPKMLERRLQIQQRITKHDRIRYFGLQHFCPEREMTSEDVRACVEPRVYTCRDMRKVINALCSGGDAPERDPACSEEDWNLLHRNISA